MHSMATINFIANEKFYLPIRFYNYDKTFFKITEKNNVHNWQAIRDRIFIQYSPKKEKLPEHGWKIHVSASKHNNKEILSIVSKYCFDNNISFKFWLDDYIFELMNNKNAQRGSSGKFMTIYPRNNDEFFEHIKGLDMLLKNYVGPYILTDRRFNNNKVLYYRYGQILPKSKSALIYGPDNQIFVDDRSPVFRIPTWVKDPFPISPNNEPKYLGKKYKIEKAIRFTNAGGTYLALNLTNNEKVIIKEARPYTAEFGKNTDSEKMKKNEYKLLKYFQTHFTDNEFPKPIDIFKEWEHTYIVETYVPGVTVKEYLLNNSYFVKSRQGLDTFKNYLKEIFIIINKIIKLIKKVHKHNILINDISPENIILDEKLNPTIIDLDGAINLNEAGEKILIGTRGFHDEKDVNLSVNRDYKSIGYLAFNMLSPTINLSTIDDSFIERHLLFLNKKFNIPIEFCNYIKNLVYYGSVSNISFIEMEKLINNIKFPEYSLTLSELNISDKIIKAYNFIDDNKVEDFELMFPSNPFAKNYIGLASGTAGVLFSVNKIKNLNANIKVDVENIKEFLLYQYNLYMNSEQLDFSLLDGTAGIIWTLLDLDIEEQEHSVNPLINSLLKNVKNSINNKETNFSIEDGLAGKALALLKSYLICNNQEYLSVAERVCDWIIEQLYKKDPVYISKIGLNKGYTGIALLFYYIYKATGQEKYFNYGYEILCKDLYEFKEIEKSWLYPEERNKKTSIYYPYLSSGTAGILAVFLRYVSENSDIFDEKILEKLVKGIESQFSVDLSLFSGLTGLINVHYDINFFINDFDNKNTLSLLDNLLSILKENEDNTLNLPGQLMYKYGCDYSNGGSGLIELMNRFNNNDRNYYVFIDSYFD
ncbi:MULTISPECIES: lanthionine synthetase LanC family protein [unclassified Nosocomiicoccus]|uniref:class III lanthionine synthetase LanKC N-terminal domain-containing protein n=1 Tax=unclassified Nosocomiicoccus TaxID=2646683 RepID=UPI0008A28CA1|nr:MULTISPECIES: lanthionine synthetase LanC family protein [unclassified Nosocomiicoccus]OFL47420.1 hypothetical protein HMPREF2767_02775 [Nosocomiicoccus sp. HMSC067E10]OFO53385.1 hypothetical protein HMPREF3029_01295 [Nosocomiicoccus sp. HMSC059G07]